jgi:hypothetical protein
MRLKVIEVPRSVKLPPRSVSFVISLSSTLFGACIFLARRHEPCAFNHSFIYIGRARRLGASAELRVVTSDQSDCRGYGWRERRPSRSGLLMDAKAVWGQSTSRRLTRQDGLPNATTKAPPKPSQRASAPLFAATYAIPTFRSSFLIRWRSSSRSGP